MDLALDTWLKQVTRITRGEIITWRKLLLGREIPVREESAPTARKGKKYQGQDLERMVDGSLAKVTGSKENEKKCLQLSNNNVKRLGNTKQQDQGFVKNCQV